MSDRDIIAATISEYVVKVVGIHWPIPDDQADVMADAIAAALRQARTITTIDQLDALPEGALLGLMDEGNLIDVVDEWDHDDREEMVSHWEVVVLWRPEDTDQ